MSRDLIQRHLLHLLEDYGDFNSSPITVQPIPSAVEFSKHVSRGYPCLYQAYNVSQNRQGGIDMGTDPSLLDSAAFRWTKQDLLNLVPGDIEVAVTPSGRADDIASVDGQEEPVFLAPATINLSMGELLHRLGESSPNNSVHKDCSVYYLQSQNSNLTTTSLTPMLKHLPENFPFAQPILSDPEAINIWIGDSRSVTSTHRDPYENLYLVLRGSKTFTLFPPVDEFALPTLSVRTGKYTFDSLNSAFSTVLDVSEDVNEPAPRLPWISADPLRSRDDLIADYPLYAHSSPRIVTVHEGQILYLPAGWFHHVQQECGIWYEDGSIAPCIAVNYWYDMEYDGEKYVMRQLLGRLVEEMRKG